MQQKASRPRKKGHGQPQSLILGLQIRPCEYQFNSQCKSEGKNPKMLQINCWLFFKWKYKIVKAFSRVVQKGKVITKKSHNNFLFRTLPNVSHVCQGCKQGCLKSKSMTDRKTDRQKIVFVLLISSLPLSLFPCCFCLLFFEVNLLIFNVILRLDYY